MIEYVPGNSVVHRLNPLTKLVWLLSVMVLALSFTHYVYLLAVLASVILVALLGRVFGKLVSFFKGLIIFSLVILLLQILFNKSGPVVCYLLPGQYLAVHQQALQLGVAMGFRMMAIILSFLIFLSTTQYKDITLTLTEKLKLPYNYVFMFMTALRFVPVFLNEMKSVNQAQAARGWTVDGNNPLIKLKAYKSVAVPLVLISLLKAERLAMAMETRGYGSGRRTTYKKLQLERQDSLALTIIVSLSLLVLCARFRGYGIIQL